MKTTKPKVTARKRHVAVNVGGYDSRPASQSDPDFVHVLVAEPEIDGDPSPQRGTIFLDICLGTVTWDGKRSFAEFDGCVQPSQLDTLIACLTLARSKAAEVGILAEVGSA